VVLRPNHSQTVRAGFQVKLLETVAAGFEAKPSKSSPLVLRPNRQKPSKQTVAINFEAQADEKPSE
jgi:hypothetical protein